jgi:DNA polymerase-1
VHLILHRDEFGVILTAVEVASDGSVALVESSPPRRIRDLAQEVRAVRSQRPRWVWSDTDSWYPELLAAGVEIDRCFDLRLSHAIVRHSTRTARSSVATRPAGAWDAPADRVASEETALFPIAGVAGRTPALDPLQEFRDLQEAVAASDDPAGLRLLLAAESAGALVAAEIRFAGLPWHADRHRRMLEETLGERPAAGARPARMQELLGRIRSELDSPGLNPDSPPDLLRALNGAGLRVESTRSWELERVEHPVVAPLLAYKKLARLLTANGWSWLDANVADGRFRPDYIPGGVVTGRWGSRGGGGALQLPRQVRSAVVADPGWRLVVADAAQLEPRILAALSGDRRMMAAGRGDLYAGIVASGAVATRDQAKVAMLGAMYGATSGESGRLLPRLTRAFPDALALVEDAARAGERGESVTTRLGRSSPGGPGPGYDETASPGELRRRQSVAQARGRFTRNFVVQGTAAEWALCWMGALRRRLGVLGEGLPLTARPHLVFFLHDELVVHTPEEHAHDVSRLVVEAAEEAGTLLFGTAPIAFPLTVAVVEDYAQAK